MSDALQTGTFKPEELVSADHPEREFWWKTWRGDFYDLEHVLNIHANELWDVHHIDTSSPEVKVIFCRYGKAAK